jgi:Uma2 family endonuclease
MTTATDTPPPAEKRYTEADLLAMPDDGVRRWLIDGKIVVVGGVAPEDSPVTIRNKHHTTIEAQIVFLLKSWLEPQPRPRGRVLTSEVGVRFPGERETTVGIDTIYIDADLAARTTANEDSTIVEGVPTLAVEILSPSDTVENLHTKIRTYRRFGVPLVWVIDPDFRTVTVHRPNQSPLGLNEEQELDGGPELPGFRVPVARIFEDGDHTRVPILPTATADTVPQLPHLRLYGPSTRRVSSPDAGSR